MVVNIAEIKTIGVYNNKDISEFHACFLAIKKEMLFNDSQINLNEFIYNIDTTIIHKEELLQVDLNDNYSSSLLEHLLNNKGNDVPVSLIPKDGSYPTDTSKYTSFKNSNYLPKWNTSLCTQCGMCSMACPQAALRIKVFEDKHLEASPENFKHTVSKDFDLMIYAIQTNPEQCNGCNNCIDACPAKALTMVCKTETLTLEKENWHFFESLPEFKRTNINVNKVSQQQLQEPLFKYSSGVEGCGEAPYLKLLSQLFGNRLLIANATGASSIFGGALPTTPWSKNAKGQGPAWSNSLFEDNAEFGLGFRLSLDHQKNQAKQLLKKLIPNTEAGLANNILEASQQNETEIDQQQLRVTKLKEQLFKLHNPEAKQLLEIVDSLVKKSIWIVGGDGWAYDIGYGGLGSCHCYGKKH